MYNSDTVYSTVTFRPVSMSPSAITTTDSSSPQRTRKLETPLPFDGGLFSDIRSADGKLLSKVTVDRVHCSSRRDVTDSPRHADELVKTETITNEDVIKVKFTPMLQELDSLPLRSSPRISKSYSPVKYISDHYEDLNSYKIVNSLCKENLLKVNTLEDADASDDDATRRSVMRGHSPLANLIVSEQLTRIDGYLQESLDVCSKRTLDRDESIQFKSEEVQPVTKAIPDDDHVSHIEVSDKVSIDSLRKSDDLFDNLVGDSDPVGTKLNSVKIKHSGVLNTIYNMPMHYHAAMLCFFLIVYNLCYQYIKQNYHGKHQHVK